MFDSSWPTAELESIDGQKAGTIRRANGNWAGGLARTAWCAANSLRRPVTVGSICPRYVQPPVRIPARLRGEHRREGAETMTPATITIQRREYVVTPSIETATSDQSYLLSGKRGASYIAFRTNGMLLVMDRKGNLPFGYTMLSDEGGILSIA